jgi:hypothetical protein
MVGNVAASLQLPDHMRIHSTFHVSLLRAYRTATSAAPAAGEAPSALPPPAEPPLTPAWLTTQPLYSVERILDYRARRMDKGRKKRLVHEYFVKWAGYTSEHNSWEPAKSFTPDLAEALAAAKRRALDAAGTLRPEGG